MLCVPVTSSHLVLVHLIHTTYSSSCTANTKVHVDTEEESEHYVLYKSSVEGACVNVSIDGRNIW